MITLGLPFASTDLVPEPPSGWDRLIDLLSTPGMSALGVIVAAVITCFATLAIAKRQRVAAAGLAEQSRMDAAEATQRELDAAERARQDAVASAGREASTLLDVAERERAAALEAARMAWKRQKKLFRQQQTHERRMFERRIAAERAAEDSRVEAEEKKEVRRRAVEQAERLLPMLRELEDPNLELGKMRNLPELLRGTRAVFNSMHQLVAYLDRSTQERFQILFRFPDGIEYHMRTEEAVGGSIEVDKVRGLLNVLAMQTRLNLMSFISSQELKGESLAQIGVKNLLKLKDEAAWEDALIEARKED